MVSGRTPERDWCQFCCVVSLDKWVQATYCWGEPCDGSNHAKQTAGNIHTK